MADATETSKGRLSIRDIVLSVALLLGGGGGLAGADQLSELTSEVRLAAAAAVQRSVRLGVAEAQVAANESGIKDVKSDYLTSKDAERFESALDELRAFHPRRAQ
jgi:hypothetical protein